MAPRASTPAVILSGLALSCAPSTFIDVPEDISAIAWLDVDSTGNLRDASAVSPVEAARVWAVDRDRDLVFVGFRSLDVEIGAPLSEVVGCEARLAPFDWVQSTGDPVMLPRLRIPSAEALCGRGSSAVECDLCTGTCDSLSSFETGVDLEGNLHGLLRIADDRFFVSGPPDQLGIVSFDPEGLDGMRLATSLVSITGTVERSLATRDRSVFVPLAEGVVELDLEGQTRRTLSIPFPVPPQSLRVVGDASLILAFVIGGPVFAIPPTGTVAMELTDLPNEVYDVAISPVGSIAILTASSVLSFSTTTEDVPLPPELPSVKVPLPTEGARIGIVGEDIVVGIEGADVYRYRDGAWSPVGWPSMPPAQPRAFASFLGGVLVAGRSEVSGGMVFVRFRDEACRIPVRQPVNAVSVRKGERSAYAVTSGPQPSLVEVRAP